VGNLGRIVSAPTRRGNGGPVQPLILAQLARISRNSFGPLISLRLRSCRSSSVTDGSPSRSTSWPAIYAFAALLVRTCARRACASPSSTSWRIASDRVVCVPLAHFSTAKTALGVSRTGIVSLYSRPGGRPLDFLRAAFCAIIFRVHEKRAEGKVKLPHRR
jgi:hypothetical protein